MSFVLNEGGLMPADTSPLQISLSYNLFSFRQHNPPNILPVNRLFILFECGAEIIRILSRTPSGVLVKNMNYTHHICQ